MHSHYPYPGFTWQVSQHVAVVNERNILGLLKACVRFDGKAVDPAGIDAEIDSQGIITSATGRSIWRDYQQVLCEFGFMYATDVNNNEIKLTPLAWELLAGKMTFNEILSFQLLKYQYPNAYKNTISSKLRGTLRSKASGFASLVELQEHYGVNIRPIPFLWLLLDRLAERLGSDLALSTKEVATYAFRCKDYCEIDNCIEDFVAYKSGAHSLSEPESNVRRNASDWFSLMAMTRFFVSSGSAIKRSPMSIAAKSELRPLFESLCDVSTFWVNDEENDLTWYEQYGSLDCPLRELILQSGKKLWSFFPNLITNGVFERNNFH